MNAISALIFVVFIGGAALSYAAHMPLIVPIVLALVGFFLGNRSRWPSSGSAPSCSAWAGCTRIKGPGVFMLVPIVDRVADLGRPAHPDHRIQRRAGALQGHRAGEHRRGGVLADPRRRTRGAGDRRLPSARSQRVAQTSLREMVGSSVLSDAALRTQAGRRVLRDEIARKIADWGVAVTRSRSATSACRPPCRTP